MKAIFAIALFAVVAMATTETELYKQFVDWTVAQGKVYANADEHSVRFENFKHNVALINHLNRQSEGARFALNKFADLSADEFAATYIRPMPMPTFAAYANTAKANLRDYPATLDLRDKGAITPIKDQAQCGSCWAFSATGNMEGVYFIAHKELPSLSEQQLVDCEKDCMIYPGTTEKVCDEGCNGGLMPNAFTYAIREGMMTEADYPYKGVDQDCKYDAAKAKYHFSAWNFVSQAPGTASTEDQMVADLNEVGPISVGVDATYWSFYAGGIYSSSCSSSRMNHGVLLIGYGTEAGKDYWIVKNSWGTSWGEKGYIRLIRGENKCGINNFACTIVA